MGLGAHARRDHDQHGVASDPVPACHARRRHQRGAQDAAADGVSSALRNWRARRVGAVPARVGRGEEGVPRQRRPRLDVSPGGQFPLPRAVLAQAASRQAETATAAPKRLGDPAAARAETRGDQVVSTYSIGAERVRLGFNPSGNSTVDQIKQDTADLIDLVETFHEAAIDTNNAELARLASLACTAYEEAAMWAVKAATMPQPPD